MRWIVVAFLALAGCSSEAANLERQYDIVSNGSDNRATCEAARKVANAYLSAGEAAKYNTAKLRADIDCSTAEYEPFKTTGPDGAPIEPDNMEALPDNTTG